MIGREAPLDFFRRSGIPIRGEWRPATYVSFAAFFLFCFFLYNWKAGGAVNQYFQQHGLFPYNVPKPRRRGGSIAAALAREPCSARSASSRTTPASTTRSPTASASLLFGIRRIRRRQDALRQLADVTLMRSSGSRCSCCRMSSCRGSATTGVFDPGFGRTIADNLFPDASYGHGREYWRAFGFILAWPLFIWNFFYRKPLTLVARDRVRCRPS